MTVQTLIPVDNFWHRCKAILLHLTSQQAFPLASEFKKKFNYSPVWMGFQSLSQTSTFQKKKKKKKPKGN